MREKEPRFYCRMFCCDDHIAEKKEFKKSEDLSKENSRLHGMIYRQQCTIAELQAKLEEVEQIKAKADTEIRRTGYSYLRRSDTPAPPVVTHTILTTKPQCPHDGLYKTPQLTLKCPDCGIETTDMRPSDVAKVRTPRKPRRKKEEPPPAPEFTRDLETPSPLGSHYTEPYDSTPSSSSDSSSTTTDDNNFSGGGGSFSGAGSSSEW